MLNPTVLLTLAFKKMLYDNSRKMGNPVPPAPSGVAMDGDTWGWNFMMSPFMVYSYKRLHFKDSGTTSLL